MGFILALLLFSINIYSYDFEFVGEINKDTSSQFYDFVSETNKRNIDILIDSGGGYVISGFRIIDIIKEYQSYGYKFKCTVRFKAMSMAFTILQTCDKRVSKIYSLFMQHESYPKGWLSREFDVIRFRHELKKLDINVAVYYTQYVMREAYFNALVALSIGAVDYIDFPIGVYRIER